MSSSYELGLSAVALLIILGGTYLVARSFAGLFAGAPYVPTLKRNVEDAMDLAKFKPGEWVTDLGSGDGKIVLAALKRGVNAVGYEISPVLAFLSRLRIRSFGSRGSILRKDFFKEDLSRFDVVFVFQLMRLMPRLSEQLLKQGKREVRVISFIFQMPAPAWKLIERKGIVKLFVRADSERGLKEPALETT